MSLQDFSLLIFLDSFRKGLIGLVRIHTRGCYYDESALLRSW